MAGITWLGATALEQDSPDGMYREMQGGKMTRGALPTRQ